MTTPDVNIPSFRVFGMIPARMASTRLPDKPLADIAGQPMIQHVWERARAARGVEQVLLVTPDAAIIAAAERFGATALLTSDRHRSGTDRLAEAAAILQLPEEAIVINIQGDEPLLEPTSIEAVLAPLLADPSLPMSSLMCPCPQSEWDNPNTVKVVCGLNGRALYFSRAHLPFPRQATGAQVMQHIGLYAYRRDFLARYAALAPTPLEQTESLEQLRVLEHGFAIQMVEVAQAPVGVDTPEDLARVRALVRPQQV